MSNTLRSVLELNVDELGEVLANNCLPDDVGLQGIEDRGDFRKLFAHRASPKYIAQILLKEKVTQDRRGGCQSPDTAENKATRLALKEQEIALRQTKVETMTQMQNNIYRLQQKIDDQQDYIISLVVELRGIIRKLQES